MRAWADIDLGAVVANARTVAEAAGARLLPMVKANGYGLGAVRVARVLERADPWGFGVATVQEGAELRRAGVLRPVMVFSPLHPHEVQLHLQHDLRPAIGDFEALQAWTGATERPFHVEIDTGMSRSGFRWSETGQIAQLLEQLPQFPGWEGMYTHFHSADDGPSVTEEQWLRFQAILGQGKKRPALIHAANSAAALRDRRYAGDLVRPGIFLYGGEAGGRYPVAVVQLKARVVAVRQVRAGDSVSYGATWRAEAPTTVATLGIGYADGVPRALAPRGRVELNGRIVPLVGRVTMDMVMVAVADGQVKPGDEVTVYGGRVSLDQQAAAAGTISYELLTGIGPRVTRRYVD
ncbi:MAG: alanine racemase [Gemmatimonadales bacterium]